MWPKGRIAAGVATGIVTVLGVVAGAVPRADAMERPGERFRVEAADLPEPYATQSVANSVNTVRRPETFELLVPEGFEATLFADDLSHPRNLVVTGDGSVYLAQSRAGVIARLRDSDGDGRADRRETLLDDFARPHGLALHDGFLYFADLEAVWRATIRDDGTLAEAERLTEPGALGPGSGHWTRNIAIAPDASALFVAIGSRGNIAEEPEPRATIQRFAMKADGTLGARSTHATGLRNPVGTAFHPETGDLYTVVNERDGMGDGLVPDYLTRVEEGAFYGWPYAYAGGLPQPDYAEDRPDLVEATVMPDMLIQSHSAPIGLAFLDGADVPADWRDDALIALRGSWNAAIPRGYKVVRAVFEDGTPTGDYVNFATGFRLDDPDEAPNGPADVWGRPTGVAVMPDGSILISDDTGGTIWRVTRR
ncbi:PQQ-dependent sugar dehydrogenase [Marivibrio halodurans]|uniref:PQQ-dependent sugar dehydrogenase n=1 Tax=Marivibrio halodurans TaxID=2039722 RepID=A0A8J7S1Y7_9PROT|nr:PQQ-dependent sugar dehydrogenase [Marivibrio halodurans]MBP5858785.1 PQQ-dependent sugar dehydrogenase [Marivibrio halodurans]